MTTLMLITENNASFISNLNRNTLAKTRTILNANNSNMSVNKFNAISRNLIKNSRTHNTR